MYFAPGYDATGATLDHSWTAVKSDNATDTVSGYANITGGKTVSVFDSIPALSYVTIYVYYEGEDENCVTNNTAAGVDTLTVSVGFKATAKDPKVTIAQTTGAEEIKATAAHVPSTKTPSYKWQVYNTAWEDVSGATSNVLNTGLVYGSKYRCIMTVDSTPYTSNEVTYAAS